LASQRALPRRAQEMGYRFQFEELEGALREILQT
jgi:NAD dependent epimerase/dehydratase family enzyme